jgi:hyperosmotically inducible protein
VCNRIVVAGPPFTVERLRSAIEGALMRRADREADGILVSVAGDTITLSGAVDSWSEKWAVLDAARHTQGVRAVVDQLHVQDSA